MASGSPALTPGFSNVIRRGLVRLHDAHGDALGKVLNDSLAVFHPNQRGTVRQSLELFTTGTVGALNEHLASVMRFVVESVETTHTALNEAKVDELVALVQAALDPDLYALRFDVFEESFARHAGRYGSAARLSDVRSDLIKAASLAGTANRVRAFSGEVRDALLTRLERQRNQAAMTDKQPEKGIDQLNRFVKLEPNFFGIGLNFNYLVRLWRGKKD